MAIFEDDLPPGQEILQSAPRRGSLIEELLAAIADELHQINQQISDRYL